MQMRLTSHIPLPLTTEENDDDDPIWQALADCEIKISMQKLIVGRVST